MFCQRAWRHHSKLHRNSFGSVFVGEDSQQATDAGGHGFLNIVFTRALRTSAHRRLRSASNDVDKSSAAALVCDGSYVDEICLRVQPCDVVFNGPVVACLLDVFLLFDGGGGAPERRRTSSGSSSSIQPLVSSASLPLLYVDASGIRLFFPCVSSAEAGQEPRVAEVADVCVLQLGSLTIVPQAINPLPRLVVNKELYARAVQSGSTSQPASELEDRQYQLDLRGLSLSTGSWAQLVSKADSAGPGCETNTNQNPALAWNMLRNVW